MTREELREHCEKQIENCEMWAKYKGEEPHGKIYEEHKLILELLMQEPRWIPVSERLPEENGGYLVTLKQGYVTTALWVGNVEYWNEVEAWMLLPPCYEPQESEE